MLHHDMSELGGQKRQKKKVHPPSRETDNLDNDEGKQSNRLVVPSPDAVYRVRNRVRRRGIMSFAVGAVGSWGGWGPRLIEE